jgi:hypothetical protein
VNPSEWIKPALQRRSISNYSTSIAPEKTVGEIAQLLAAAKATAILSEYHDGVLMAISFRIQTEFGILTFRLRANVEGVHASLLRSKQIPSSLRNHDQARRVAWRIVLHWLDAQLALIAAGLATLDQVFLPFCQDQHGVTLYERMRQAKFSGLSLTDKPSS